MLASEFQQSCLQQWRRVLRLPGLETQFDLLEEMYVQTTIQDWGPTLMMATNLVFSHAMLGIGGEDAGYLGLTSPKTPPPWLALISLNANDSPDPIETSFGYNREYALALDVKN